MQALRSAPPGRLTVAESQRLREHADTLLFAARVDREVKAALAQARAILVTRAEGSLDPWVDTLARNLRSCAPRARLLARP